MTLTTVNVPGIGEVRLDPETETLALISREVAAEASTWSEPVQVKVVPRDGMVDLLFRTIGDHPIAQVDRIARESDDLVVLRTEPHLHPDDIEALLAVVREKIEPLLAGRVVVLAGEISLEQLDDAALAKLGLARVRE